MAYALRLRMDKWDLIKLQSFLKAKDTVNRKKMATNRLEKNFTNPTSDRGLISNIYKELKTVDAREPNDSIKNEVQILLVQASAHSQSHNTQRKLHSQVF